MVQCIYILDANQRVAGLTSRSFYLAIPELVLNYKSHVSLWFMYSLCINKKRLLTSVNFKFTKHKTLIHFIAATVFNVRNIILWTWYFKCSVNFCLIKILHITLQLIQMGKTFNINLSQFIQKKYCFIKLNFCSNFMIPFRI